jgi:hypothetical protein
VRACHQLKFVVSGSVVSAWFSAMMLVLSSDWVITMEDKDNLLRTWPRKMKSLDNDILNKVSRGRSGQLQIVTKVKY